MPIKHLYSECWCFPLSGCVFVYSYVCLFSFGMLGNHLLIAGDSLWVGFGSPFNGTERKSIFNRTHSNAWAVCSHRRGKLLFINTKCMNSAKIVSVFVLYWGRCCGLLRNKVLWF